MIKLSKTMNKNKISKIIKVWNKHTFKIRVQTTVKTRTENKNQKHRIYKN